MKKEYKHLRSLYTARRRTAMEILNQMSEGQGKRVPELIEEIGQSRCTHPRIFLSYF